MKTIVAKLDDKTAQDLDELAKHSSRSDIVREAIRKYVADRRIAERRRQVEEYVRTSGEGRAMRKLAECDMDHAAELLERTEEQK